MPTIEAATETMLLRYAITYCKARGCTVREPDNRAQWLTPKELSEKTGLKSPALCKRLKSKTCPAFEQERGKKRVLRILAHERLLEFLRQPKQPGLRLSANPPGLRHERGE